MFGVVCFSLEQIHVSVLDWDCLFDVPVGAAVAVVEVAVAAVVVAVVVDGGVVAAAVVVVVVAVAAELVASTKSNRLQCNT